MFLREIYLKNSTFPSVKTAVDTLTDVRNETSTYFVNGVANRLEVFPRWKRKRIAGLIKVAEHSFQVPMPNSPLLLNHLCFGAHFLQE